MVFKINKNLSYVVLLIFFHSGMLLGMIQVPTQNYAGTENEIPTVLLRIRDKAKDIQEERKSNSVIYTLPALGSIPQFISTSLIPEVTATRYLANDVYIATFFRPVSQHGNIVYKYYTFPSDLSKIIFAELDRTKYPAQTHL